jgi:hypothetical protein
VGYVEGYNILILGIYKFLYPISFLEKIDNFGVLLPYKMHFLLNKEINSEYPLLSIDNILKSSFVTLQKKYFFKKEGHFVKWP